MCEGVVMPVRMWGEDVGISLAVVTDESPIPHDVVYRFRFNCVAAHLVLLLWKRAISSWMSTLAASFDGRVSGHVTDLYMLSQLRRAHVGTYCSDPAQVWACT